MEKEKHITTTTAAATIPLLNTVFVTCARGYYHYLVAIWKWLLLLLLLFVSLRICNHLSGFLQLNRKQAHFTCHLMWAANANMTANYLHRELNKLTHTKTKKKLIILLIQYKKFDPERRIYTFRLKPNIEYWRNKGNYINTIRIIAWTCTCANAWSSLYNLVPN